MAQLARRTLRIGFSDGQTPAATGGRRQPHALEIASENFDVVEIKRSFDEFLKPEITRLWARKVGRNPDFRFTAKLHRLFSHERVLEPGRVARWSNGIRPLAEAGRLDAVLMQFPWSFKFTAENRAHLIELRRTFHEVPLVAEFRHASWSLEEALGTLIDYKIGFCNIDQPEYARSMPPTRYLTSAVGYVRLHGRNSFGFAAARPGETRYDYDYTESELSDWVTRIEHLQEHAARTVVIANNGDRAKSMRTAWNLVERMGEPRQPSPLLMLPGRKSAMQVPMFGGADWSRVA